MSRAKVSGFTLVELMISMVLGLIVVGGVISILISNRRSYDTNESMSQVQESARSAFELIARDIRQSGDNGCDNSTGIANVLKASSTWWSQWYGLRGFDSTQIDNTVGFGVAEGQRIAGTDSIHTQGVDGIPLPLEIHDVAGARLEINAATTPFAASDIMIVCDYNHSAIFQASGYVAGSSSVLHAPDIGSPGNCSQGLGFPTDCATATGLAYAYPRNSPVSRMAAVAWYVGANGRPGESGRSLYRRRLASGGNVLTEEVVAGVTDLELSYGVADNNVIESAVEVDAAGDWQNVTSVFVQLTVDSADARISTDTDVNNGRLQRTFNYVITLRNRVR